MIYRFDKTIYKYRNLEGLKKMITDKTIYLATPASFNDPFEFSTKLLEFNLTDKFAKNQIKKGFHHLKGKMSKFDKKQFLKKVTTQMYSDTALEALERHRTGMYGVFCGSEIYNSILMWSHYAENHKGFCIGFDFPKSYPNINRLISQYVNYTKEIKQIPVVKNRIFMHDEALLHWLSTKSDVWAYEKEVRFFKYDGAGAIKFNPLSVNELYIGLATPQEDIDLIDSMLKENGFCNCKLSKMKFGDSNFDIVATPYKR